MDPSRRRRTCVRRELAVNRKRVRWCVCACTASGCCSSEEKTRLMAKFLSCVWCTAPDSLQQDSRQERVGDMCTNSRCLQTVTKCVHAREMGRQRPSELGTGMGRRREPQIGPDPRCDRTQQPLSHCKEAHALRSCRETVRTFQLYKKFPSVNVGIKVNLLS